MGGIVFLLTRTPGGPERAGERAVGGPAVSEPPPAAGVRLAESDTVRLGLERAETWGASSADGPSVVDELLLLVAFDWSPEEVLERLAARNPLARAEALEDLLSKEPIDEDTDGAGLILACIESLGLEDEAAAAKLFHWADRHEARQLMRSVARVLVEQGPRGRELAARLAQNQWERSLQDPNDAVGQLCASYVVAELGDARASEAAPYLRTMVADAVGLASDVARTLEGVQDRIQELSVSPDSARSEWEKDPASKRVAMMWRWRNRAAYTTEALLRIDSPEVAEWVEETLRGREDQPADWTADVVVSALEETLPELLAHEDGPTVARLRPWILERLAAGVDETSWQFPVIYRLAGVCGADALPALRAVVARGGAGIATEEAVAGIARIALSAPETASDATTLAVLRDFVRGERQLSGDGSSLATYGLALRAVAAAGDDGDAGWIRERLRDAQPDEVALLLPHVPADVWEEEPMALFALLERMEPRLAADASASVVVDLALDRLLDAVGDPRPLLETLSGSPSERLAQKAGAAALRAGLAHADTTEERLGLVRERFAASLNPFRSQQHGPSLWAVAVELAGDPQESRAAVADELARDASPLGMRVAMGRGLALRGAPADLSALELECAELALAARAAVRADVRWARRFELGQWKTLAWLAVTGERGCAIARGALEAIEDGRGSLQPALEDRLPLLERYLEAQAASGWHVHDERLAELALAWNRDEDRDHVLARVQALCAEAPARWLEALVARRELPLAVRAEVLGSLFDAPDYPVASVQELAAALAEAEWSAEEADAVEAGFVPLVRRAGDARAFVAEVVRRLDADADPSLRSVLERSAARVLRAQTVPPSTDR